MEAAHGVSAGPAGSSIASGPPPATRAAVVLGNDAVVAARPMQPAQLAHACRAAGFDVVVPPAWGDELVANEFLERLSGCGDRIAIGCACPRVRALLAHQRTDDTPPRVDISAPPVAVAKYLRLVYGNSMLITYVGDCPSADDPSINARFSPPGFFASLHRQGISLATQPNVATDAEAARWQRYRSIPGGLPALRWLARAPVDRVLREADAEAIQSHVWPTTPRSNVLVDMADAVGCVCGGNRAAIEQFEPVRATSPVIVAPPDLDLRLTSALSAPRVVLEVEDNPERSERTAIQPGVAEPPAATVPLLAPVAPVPVYRPPSPPSVSLPPARRDATQRTMEVKPTARNRGTILAVLPAVVLAFAAALGAAAYSLVSPGRVQAPPATGESSPASRVTSVDALDTTKKSGAQADSISASATLAARADSVKKESASIAQRAANETAGDSSTAKPRRPRRSPEVVPGWLPQGTRAWSPADSLPTRSDSARNRRVKRDTLPPT